MIDKAIDQCKVTNSLPSQNPNSTHFQKLIFTFFPLNTENHKLLKRTPIITKRLLNEEKHNGKTKVKLTLVKTFQSNH